MTKFETLEQLAYQNEPMPPYKTEAEVFAFIALRSLYRDYLTHRISRDEAKIERRKIKGMFEELNTLKERLWKQNQQLCRLRVELAKVSREIETGGCPLCQKMMKLMDGRIALKEDNA